MKKGWMYIFLGLTGLVLFILFKRKKENAPEPVTIARPSNRIKTILPAQSTFNLIPPNIQKTFNDIFIKSTPAEPLPPEKPLFPIVNSNLPMSATPKIIPAPKSDPITIVNTDPPLQILSRPTDYRVIKTTPTPPLGISRMR